jgi:hypothetical protein
VSDLPSLLQALSTALGLQKDRPVSAFPDWLDSDDEPDADWIVGIAKEHDGTAYELTSEMLDTGEYPGIYEVIATVRGEARAVALARLLNALRTPTAEGVS